MHSGRISWNLNVICTHNGNIYHVEIPMVGKSTRMHCIYQNYDTKKLLCSIEITNPLTEDLVKTSA